MKRIIRKMVCVAVVLSVCLTALSATVFARTKLYGLTKDEVFDCIWHKITQSSDGLKASLMYDECKEYVAETDFDHLDFDDTDGFNDFMKWYKNKLDGVEILPYSEKIIEYLKENPDADLIWSSYGVYDKNIQVETEDNMNASKKNNLYMQYDQKNISNILIWTYDSETNNFICKNDAGEIVRKVYAYSKPYYSNSESEASDNKQNSVSNLSNTDNVLEEKAADEAIEESETDMNESDSGIVVDYAEEQAEEISESGNAGDNTTAIIIIISGVVIVGVFAFLIIRQKTKKV